MNKANGSKGNYLYRYQPFHRKNIEKNNFVDNLEIFQKKELFFVSPLDFNDPFDCKAFLTHNGCTAEDLFKYICWQFKCSPLRQTNTDEEIRNDAFNSLCDVLGDEIFKGVSELSESLERHKANYFRDIKGDASTDKQGIGVLSLSGKNDNILMWGHYADGHKGYCLEFNRERLENWLKVIPAKLAKVDYMNSYPTLRDFLECVKNGIGSSLDGLFLLRKSSHWGYEEEWRAIVNIDWKVAAPQIHSFPEQILTGVIFGCEMPDEHIITIRSYLDSWNEKPKIYRADKSESNYALEIKEMER